MNTWSSNHANHYTSLEKKPSTFYKQSHFKENESIKITTNICSWWTVYIYWINDFIFINLEARKMNTCIINGLETVGGGNNYLDKCTQSYKSLMNTNWFSFDQIVPKYVIDQFSKKCIPNLLVINQQVGTFCNPNRNNFISHTYSYSHRPWFSLTYKFQGGIRFIIKFMLPISSPLFQPAWPSRGNLPSCPSKGRRCFSTRAMERNVGPTQVISLTTASSKQLNTALLIKKTIQNNLV